MALYPLTEIGEDTPTTLPSGIGKVFPFVKGIDDTEPTAFVAPLKLIQLEGQTGPPVPAFTVGSGLTVTDCVIEF